jgi:hypothetical protein
LNTFRCLVTFCLKTVTKTHYLFPLYSSTVHFCVI